ncbi:hypothetical protein RvY_12802-1 [Ramazzottius varieornatus]|uniref:RING-type domain-containing protein n=1 Tax=Ramazzottius varieornatus TaxID=947166 RepID=A0A1D1VR59_RAMVA|nr:hypothetical protein RvY_12802-1 [Ramazzottius varieornatus]
MGNCLRRGDGSTEDYSLLHANPADQEHQNDLRQHHPSSTYSHSVGSSDTASSDFPDDLHPDEVTSRFASLMVDRQITEEEQMQKAQRFGLIQHLPSGLYDGGKKDRECPICMVELNCGDPVRFLPCMHVYHKDCIDDWLLKHSLTCPNCMEPVECALMNSYEVGNTPWNFTS